MATASIDSLPRILHQDEWILALDKPSGLLSVPGRGPALQDCLLRRVQAQFPQAMAVHRLDRDTSGVIVLALDPQTHRALGRQFERRLVKKTYVAVVSGQMPGDSGRIELPLVKDFAHPPRHKVDWRHGRPAITDWTTQTRFADRSRALLAPITGRSHQLRVHLAHVGHPVLGDPLYAPGDVAAQSDRLLLHALRLELTHPQTGERISIESKSPF